MLIEYFCVNLVCSCSRNVVSIETSCLEMVGAFHTQELNIGNQAMKLRKKKKNY